MSLASIRVPESSQSQESPSISVTVPLTASAPQPVLNAAYYGPEPIQGISPLFLTSQSQALFKIVIGEDVTAERMYRMIPKSDLISDMQTRLAISDFTPFKKDILVSLA